ncbi:MAG: hypothetical protein KY469_11400 [Actinobacteria bacterium]|nr:hypothetical protein [Actinomycetota bacterium]
MRSPRVEGELAAAVAAVPHWYHTLDLGSGVVTPGFFDLRPVVDDLPWPDVRGKRCLDVATFDGFYAFELERRGAAEVVAIDLDDAVDLDWLPRERPEELLRGDERVGDGFRVAHRALSSQVERLTCNVYDLDPGVHGMFDVVVCGALLQHLRDPFGALLAIHGVCSGQLLSVEHVDTRSSLLHRRTPFARIVGHDRTWWLPNVRGHVQLLHQSGFDTEPGTIVGIPWGPAGEPAPEGLRGRLHWLVQHLGWRLVAGSPHVPFSAVTAQAVR